MTTEQELRDFMQPMFRGELMKAWREGVNVGLNMAHTMAQSVHVEILTRREEAPAEQRGGFDSQIAAIRGLMGAFLTAAEEALHPPDPA